MRCSGVPGRDRWQASQNFAALAGVVRDAMNLPRKKIRTSLGVLSEVDNNINALTTLPWGKSASGEEQHQHARWVVLPARPYPQFPLAFMEQSCVDTCSSE